MTFAVLPLPWPFEFEFMQYALAAGVVVGATAPLVGLFLVEKRMSLMGDGIGHVAFAGVAAGLLLDVWPVWGALAVAIVGALVIEWLRAREQATGDLALALVFYGGLAAGAVILSTSTSSGVNAQQYLFGQLLTVDTGDLWVIVGLAVSILAVLALCGRALHATVLDEESARVAGIPVDFCNALLAVVTAVTVVAAMRAVGVLLVAALMVLPVASARLLARSFRSTVLTSSVVGVTAVVGGLVAAREWDIAPGGTIVLSAGFVFAAVAIFGRLASANGAH
jgi:zinc transport system permease protein